LGEPHVPCHGRWILSNFYVEGDNVATDNFGVFSDARHVSISNGTCRGVSSGVLCEEDHNSVVNVHCVDCQTRGIWHKGDDSTVVSCDMDNCGEGGRIQGARNKIVFSVFSNNSTRDLNFTSTSLDSLIAGSTIGSTLKVLVDAASTGNRFVDCDGFGSGPGVQSLSGPGAVNVSQRITHVTTTGADALTLDDGEFVGQEKEILMISDGGDGTLTPTNFGNGTTITFDDVGDYVRLQWTNGNWYVVSNEGAVVA
jgi:hypothetical protein